MSLNSLKVTELRTMAKSLGITNYSKLKKDELLAKIKLSSSSRSTSTSRSSSRSTSRSSSTSKKPVKSYYHSKSIPAAYKRTSGTGDDVNVRLSARSYFDKYGASAIGDRCNVSGKNKCLLTRSNGSPWWSPCTPNKNPKCGDCSIKCRRADAGLIKRLYL